MRDLLDKLRQIKEEIVQEKGELALFGLFEREDAWERWDLIVAARWTAVGLRASIDYVIDKMREHLTLREFLQIARVVPLLPSVPFVKTVQEMAGEVDGLKELPGFEFDGMELKRGYVLLSHPEHEAAVRAEMAAT
jgi:hypothetical protein